MQTLISNKLTKDFLNIFLSTDKFRDSMRLPYLIDGYVYATNGHIAVKVKEDLIEEITEQGKSTINFNKPFDESYSRIDKNYTFKLADFKKAFEPVKFYPVKEECVHCEGTGDTTCPCCDSEIQCNSCNGSGEYGPVVRMDPQDLYKFRILGITFSAINIHKLIQAAEYLKAEEFILKTSLEPTKTALFSINDIDIVVMPFYVANEATDIGKLATINPTN